MSLLRYALIRWLRPRLEPYMTWHVYVALVLCLLSAAMLSGRLNEEQRPEGGGSLKSVEEPVRPKPTIEQRAQAIHEVYEKRHKLKQQLLKSCSELWGDEWLACTREESAIQQQIEKEVPLPVFP
jgi:hypothetical protein